MKAKQKTNPNCGWFLFYDITGANFFVLTKQFPNTFFLIHAIYLTKRKKTLISQCMSGNR